MAFSWSEACLGATPGDFAMLLNKMCCCCWILYYLNKDCCCSSVTTSLAIRCGGRSILEKNVRSIDVESWLTDPGELLLLASFRTISLHSAADVYQEVEKHQAKTQLFQNTDVSLRPFAYFFILICDGSLLVKNCRAHICGGLHILAFDYILLVCGQV